MHWPPVHKRFIIMCSNHLSFLLLFPSSLHCVQHFFLHVTSIMNHPPLYLFSFLLLLLSSLVDLNSTLSSLPSSVPPLPLRCLTQAGGTCAPSWTVPCRMSVTCTCWWRRRRSRQFAEPSWRRGVVTVHSLTCYSLWWWGTFSLCYI